ncbi:unnamed protein product [Nippostrongylus brasiliensis]|uniref:E3 ubiquitin-protein ligase listerin n=1 Tax=Nippostrongylus brasiliensis TaxID=27835 RepID=A0A158R2L4_NIPBR|nr:unnamed protein product [Nippostrongylus brasiliensis]
MLLSEHTDCQECIASLLLWLFEKDVLPAQSRTFLLDSLQITLMNKRPLSDIMCGLLVASSSWVLRAFHVALLRVPPIQSNIIDPLLTCDDDYFMYVDKNVNIISIISKEPPSLNYARLVLRVLRKDPNRVKEIKLSSTLGPWIFSVFSPDDWPMLSSNLGTELLPCLKKIVIMWEKEKNYSAVTRTLKMIDVCNIEQRGEVLSAVLEQPHGIEFVSNLLESLELPDNLTAEISRVSFDSLFRNATDNTVDSTLRTLAQFPPCDALIRSALAYYLSETAGLFSLDESRVGMVCSQLLFADSRYLALLPTQPELFSMLNSFDFYKTALASYRAIAALLALPAAPATAQMTLRRLRFSTRPHLPLSSWNEPEKKLQWFWALQEDCSNLTLAPLDHLISRFHSDSRIEFLSSLYEYAQSDLCNFDDCIFSARSTCERVSNFYVVLADRDDLSAAFATYCGAHQTLILHSEALISSENIFVRFSALHMLRILSPAMYQQENGQWVEEQGIEGPSVSARPRQLVVPEVLGRIVDGTTGWSSIMAFDAVLTPLSTCISSDEERVAYCSALFHPVSTVLPQLFARCPEEIRKSEQYDFFTSADIDFGVDVLVRYAANLLYRWDFILAVRTLASVPAVARSWYAGLPTTGMQIVNRYVRRYVSKLLIDAELQKVKIANQGQMKGDKLLKIRVVPVSGEVVAEYTVEETIIRLSIVMPVDWPLSVPSIQIDKAIVPTEKVKKWQLQLTKYLFHQNGSTVEGIMMWRRNVDRDVEGAEACSICMMTIHMTNHQLPKYKWFETSSQSTCPLCRSNFC